MVRLRSGLWPAELGFERGDSEAARERARETAKARSKSQPIQAATAGSVFRNPEGDYAARLIESAGFEGCSGGGRLSFQNCMPISLLIKARRKLAILNN
jgi:UDP-N-acetylmuramate dehydrogenase